MTDSVRRWTRIPQPERPDVLATAMFMPGEPLTGLIEVAKMADPEAEVTIADFGRGEGKGEVAVVQYAPAGGAAQKWVIIRPGFWLGFDGRYGSLSEVSDGTLAQWYEEAEPE